MVDEKHHAIKSTVWLVLAVFEGIAVLVVGLGVLVLDPWGWGLRSERVALPEPASVTRVEVVRSTAVPPAAVLLTLTDARDVWAAAKTVSEFEDRWRPPTVPASELTLTVILYTGDASGDGLDIGRGRLGYSWTGRGQLIRQISIDEQHRLFDALQLTELILPRR